MFDIKDGRLSIADVLKRERDARLDSMRVIRNGKEGISMLIYKKKIYKFDKCLGTQRVVTGRVRNSVASLTDNLT